MDGRVQIGWVEEYLNLFNLCDIEGLANGTGILNFFLEFLIEFFLKKI